MVMHSSPALSPVTGATPATDAQGMSGGGMRGSVKKPLQAAVESLRWTYGHFWKFCPQQGVLLWSDGYYNGPIRTTKTVQPSPQLSAEEASLRRSQQLRELYELLSDAEAGQATKLACTTTALLPEDLNELEWFYLLSMSFSSHPNTGLLGKTFTSQKPLWLMEASKIESKLFPRVIIAQSANIQTIVCIPLKDGVIELGTTKKVEEDKELIKHVTVLFIDSVNSCHGRQPQPVLSEHSASNTIAPITRRFFHSPPQPMMQLAPVEALGVDKDIDDGADVFSESELQASIQLPFFNELVQLNSNSDQFRNAEDSANVDTVDQMAADDYLSRQSQHNNGYCDPWLLNDDISDAEAQKSESTSSQVFPSQQHVGYTKTVRSILHQNSNYWAELYSIRNLGSTDSAFSTVNDKIESQFRKQSSKTESQVMLKMLLFHVPFLYNKGMSVQQDDTGVSHVLAERRRREKLNERFAALRSLLPSVTKMDKSSILEHTIEYVKELRDRIHELESRNKMSTEERTRTVRTLKRGDLEDGSALRKGQLSFREISHAEVNLIDQRRAIPTETKKTRHLDSGGTTFETRKLSVETTVEVSIIDADALLEVQCPFREGLLLAIMKAFRLLHLTTTSVQSSSTNGIFNAKLRAKVCRE